MAALTTEQLLQLGKIKDAIGITGDYQDNTLAVHMIEVREFLLSAGVSAAVLDTDKAVGILARGVMDLWNYGAGDGALSPYFYQRAIQLIYEPTKSEGVE